MVAHVDTLALVGLVGTPVQVEVQVSGGLQGVFVIGLPSNAVKESRDRVRGAFHALGLSMPDKRIMVNLSPADVAKDGSHYDLPIAVGMLLAFGIVPADAADGWCVMGELGLDGSVRAVAGTLPAALHAKASGARTMVVPAANAAEAAWASGDAGGSGGMAVLGVSNLAELVRHLRGEALLTPVSPKAGGQAAATLGMDLADIRGQEGAKRAGEIAAAGGHHLLLSGPPGSGKSMLAARLPSLLPPLTPGEALEVSMIHSVAGLLPAEQGLLTGRPFRDPHHSASSVALTGGGLRAKPGEMSLAHRGILFLDELPEFPRAVLETLRQPLETGTITIARASAHVTYPARFQLIAAMNPCACGYVGDATKGCKQQPGCAAVYQNRLSGPLLDRFDLRVNVPPVKATDLSLPAAKEGTAAVAARVATARRRQQARLAALSGPSLTCNAELSGAALEACCELNAECRTMLNTAAERMGLSARGYHRVLRVARTIADLAESDAIAKPHVAEALAYRVQG
jgi:magnesium chelatase family protein